MNRTANASVRVRPGYLSMLVMVCFGCWQFFFSLRSAKKREREREKSGSRKRKVLQYDVLALVRMMRATRTTTNEAEEGEEEAEEEEKMIDSCESFL